MIDERERLAAPLMMREWCLEEEGLYGVERERERANSVVGCCGERRRITNGVQNLGFLER